MRGLAVITTYIVKTADYHKSIERVSLLTYNGNKKVR